MHMFITALRALCSISAVLSQDSALFFLCMPYWKRLAFGKWDKYNCAWKESSLAVNLFFQESLSIPAA